MSSLADISMKLSFDDILLEPRYSKVYSRKDISLKTRLFSDFDLDIPIISANMPSVTGPEMAVIMRKLGGLGILHRMNTIQEAAIDYQLTNRSTVGVSVGLNEEGRRAHALRNIGARFFCVDVAHGHHERVIEMIKMLKDLHPDVRVIAGNVATTDGFYDLAEAGADAVKVGIGPGAACTTREVTGFGVPQLTAINDIARCRDIDIPNVTIIADGGIRNSGDIVKALAFGADTVMIGRLLAGTFESPDPGLYYGNASRRVSGYRAPEGEEGSVDVVGSVVNVVKQLTWGIKSGLSYAGVSNIHQLHKSPPEFSVVSSQTMVETGVRI